MLNPGPPTPCTVLLVQLSDFASITPNLQQAFSVMKNCQQLAVHTALGVGAQSVALALGGKPLSPCKAGGVVRQA